MVTTRNSPQLILPANYDPRAEYETALKGWLSDVFVETEDGVRYQVSFIDPVRLQQDMEEYVKLGRPYFGEPGLIIVPEVTTDAMCQAVTQLCKQGYFEHLRPVRAIGDEIAAAHVLQREYGLYAENRPVIRLDREMVPAHLRHLIPFAEEWGIGDDIIRCDYEAKASMERKLAFFVAVSDKDHQAVRKWLDGFGGSSLTEEAAAFMYMTLAHDEMRPDVERHRLGKQ